VAFESPFPKPAYFRPAAGERRMTELHFAAYCNDVDAVQEQLAAGAAVDARDDNGWTPVHWSIDMSETNRRNSPRVVLLLLEHGASPNAVDGAGGSVLMMACERTVLDNLKLLVEAGADIHAHPPQWTPLHMAAESGFHEGVDLLLSLGLDSAKVDAKGRTPEKVAEDGEWHKCIEVFRAARLEREWKHGD
jgi:ankyrin repeat protein